MARKVKASVFFSAASSEYDLFWSFGHRRRRLQKIFIDYYAMAGSNFQLISLLMYCCDRQTLDCAWAGDDRRWPVEKRRTRKKLHDIQALFLNCQRFRWKIYRVRYVERNKTNLFRPFKYIRYAMYMLVGVLVRGIQMWRRTAGCRVRRSIYVTLNALPFGHLFLLLI